MINLNQHDNSLVVNLRILNQIGASILSEYTVEQIIDTVYHHINQLMDAYSFAIGIYNPTSQRVEYIGARENNRKLPAFSVYAHNQGRFSGWVFANKREVLINDYEQEYSNYLPNPIIALQGMEPASLMYVPLFIGKEVLGLLSVRTMVKNAYTLQSLEILKTLAVFIAKAIENTRGVTTTDQTPARLPEAYHTNSLSAREMDVLNLLAKGMVNRAIADELFISPSTVKTHTLNIYRKLESANRTEATVKAKAYGLLQ